MPELIVTTPEGATFRYRLGQFTMIGRHPDCDIVLTDPMSSRRHCKIEQAAGGAFFIEDNGSANGTILNTEFLRTRKPFINGDVAQIGSTRMAMFVEAVKGAGGRPGADVGSGHFDPNMSIVRMKEDAGGEAAVSFDFTMDAKSGVLDDGELNAADPAALKRVTARLKLMVDLGQSLGSSLLPKTVLKTCLEKLFDVFPNAERGFILLYGVDGQINLNPNNDKDDELEGRRKPLSICHIRNPKPGQENEVAISRTVASKVKANRQAVLLSEAAGDSEFSPAMSMARLEIQSVMCTPLLAGDEDLGILYLDTKDAAHRFAKEDVSLLNAVAGQVAVLIRNAELARKAASEAANRQNLQRFLSPQLVDRVMKGEVTVDLGGSMKHGTVFFSDLVGFTRMSSMMRPQDIIALLNRYFKVMQEIIFSRQGSVDKCSGDQIMAFWGVLVDTPRAAAAAGTAALEMQNAMFVFNEDLALDKEIVKPPEPFGHGIGLNTGDFIAGNIGGDRKVEFTVIGNAVNLAQRLEATAGRGQIFIGEGTYDEMKDLAFAIRLPDTPVKNVPQPIKMFSLRGTISPDAAGKVASAGPFSQPGNEADESPILYSLPCKLKEGATTIAGIVTKMALTADGNGQLKVLTDKPMTMGKNADLLWDLPEKPSLPPMKVMVEHSWGQGEGSTLVQESQGSNRIVTLRASAVPAEMKSFAPGSLIQSDLTHPDQIIRK